MSISGIPKALRPDAGIESNRRWIHIRVAAFLELAEPIPTQAECIDQVGIEDVYFADSEVVSNGRRHAKPWIQLRSASWARSASRKFILALAV